MLLLSLMSPLFGRKGGCWGQRGQKAAGSCGVRAMVAIISGLILPHTTIFSLVYTWKCGAFKLDSGWNTLGGLHDS